MNYITLEAGKGEGVIFDLGALYQRLEAVSDKRQARGIRYRLALILMVIILAKLAGEDTPTGIAEWAALRAKPLTAVFALQRKRLPAHNTIRRVMADGLEAAELESVVKHFLHEAYGGQGSMLVVLDGKTLRGTIPAGQRQGVHLLAAYLPAEGIVLLQVAVEAKENEISAAPRVIASLDLRHRVVCGDAMFTQRNLSVEVLRQGGDYLWFLKDNQPQLHEEVAEFFVPPRQAPGWYRPPLPQATAQTQSKGHGRLEVRTLTVIADETGFLDWPGLRQVFKLERVVTRLATGQLTSEVCYGLTSLPPERASARQLLDYTRTYWGIENGLHYRRDKTLQEDATRMSNPNQAQVLATINNFVIGLVKAVGFNNLASARRHFDAHLDALLTPFS
jgi:predicted transposase YbfD/YdcC